LIVEMEDIAREVDSRIVEFERPKGQISRNRYIARNDPVIRGTRVRTEAIWNYYNSGYSIKDIKTEYPQLTKRDINAAIRFEREHKTKAA